MSVWGRHSASDERVRRRRRDVARRLLRAECGQALVEMALVLPILVLLSLGALELARGTSYWLTANHVANEAARWASVGTLPACTDSWHAGNSTSATTTPDETAFQAYMTCTLDRAHVIDATTNESASRKVCVNLPAGSTTGSPALAIATISWPIPLVGSVTISGTATLRLEQPANSTFAAGAPAQWTCP